MEESSLVEKGMPMDQMVQPLVKAGITVVPPRFIQPAESRPGPPVEANGSQIPVIDMSGLYDERRNQVLAEIAHACQEWGFFQVINHGVSPALMADILMVTKEFFALSQKEKEVNAMKPGATVGYGRLFETKNSVANWIDRLVMWTYGEKQKLAEPCMPLKPQRLGEVVDAYSNAVYQLCKRLIETLAVMLGLEPDVLGERLNVEGLGIRTSCNYYPPCPQPELVLGLTPHSDSSIFTVLQQDGDVFGLETLHNGQWFQVPPLKNAFVINGGNQLQIISNAKYKSVMHRARTNTHVGRYSFPNFLLPSDQTVIEPFPEFLSEANPPLYRSLTFAEYVNGFHSMPFAGGRHIDNFLLTRPDQ
ncbi:jasmonate-induced oxygenase 2 [Physcomitrium patens]|uniref:Fe2OG dioxygenase domain-containing protein n=1 Tax=Physcomitrium patens TaxID=3218 RepID=A0A2K1IEQ0_PHYPA|nr:probable 2-oxoglutarate-dependent dioxygenase At5g05600 [Physcomitrium patens]PNR27750.1 hypothetical protein PHYPA_029902 [Physcomitrium patens]|eukprot:XP_024365321.1 probable 2-oxoglutarate-dependent dioxygenase At5g05600 [Physcomitrella patens]